LSICRRSSEQRDRRTIRASEAKLVIEAATRIIAGESLNSE